MNKVKIKSYKVNHDCGTPEEIIIIKINNREIGCGRYSGKPEDAYQFRDYEWAETLIKKLAKELGAEVETDIKILTSEEWKSSVIEP